MNETTFTQIVSELGTLTTTFLDTDDGETAARLIEIHRRFREGDAEKLVASFDALSAQTQGAVADFCPTLWRWITELREEER